MHKGLSSLMQHPPFLPAEVGGLPPGPPPSRLLDQKWGLVFHRFIPPETHSEKWGGPCSPMKEWDITQYTAQSTGQERYELATETWEPTAEMCLRWKVSLGQ